MTYERFEDLPVWKAAMELAVGVFSLVDNSVFGGKGDLRDQLRRSSLSVSQNIAEGFERGSSAELLMFLYIARGSAGETRSGLRFCQRLAIPSDIQKEVERQINLAESVSRQLCAWADKLQNSDIQGQRHLNDRSREEWDQAKRTKAFLEKLDRIRKQGNTDPPKPES